LELELTNRTRLPHPPQTLAFRMGEGYRLQDKEKLYSIIFLVESSGGLSPFSHAMAPAIPNPTSSTYTSSTISPSNEGGEHPQRNLESDADKSTCSMGKATPIDISFSKNFERLKEAVFCKKPVLREIVEKRGEKLLYEYAREYIDVNLNPPIKQRQDEFLITFRKECSRRLGDRIAESSVRQLEKHYFVSTADHHGPLCHPFFLNSNLLIASPFDAYPAEECLENVIVLANANVSQNNSSFPRGIQFHSAHDGKTHLHSLAFFPAHSRLCPVYKFRAYTKEDIGRMNDALKEKEQNGEIAKHYSNQVQKIITEIYDTPAALGCNDFCDQVTLTNYHLWKQYFNNSKSAPNLVYIDIESISAQLLLDWHLFSETAIHNILFNEAYVPLLQQYFEGITGTYSEKDQWGTYLFWALPKGEKYRLQLWKRGNELVHPDLSYRVPLTPEGIRDALLRREIIPSTMLAYILLSFYYGLKCLGGFSQVNYLTFMKNAYIKMQVDRGNYRSIEVCARAQTKELVGDVTVAFMKAPDGNLLPATGIDMLLYGKTNPWKIFVDQTKKITLEEGLNPLMPELYRIIYAEDEQNPDLLSVTPKDISRHTGLIKKVEPCAELIP